MKSKLLVSIFIAILFAGIITTGIKVSRVSAVGTTLYINPATVTKAPGDVGSTFDVSVMISSVSDLFGFDIKITWNDNLMNFVSLDETPLSTVFGSYFTPLNPDTTHYIAGPGYIRFAAVKTGSPPGYTGSNALYSLKFTVVKGDNFLHTTSIAFDTVKLSDSAANQIVPSAMTPCSYSMSATVPDIDFTLVNIHPSKLYEYGKYFKVEVYATHITSSLTDYDLKIDYTSELLMFYNEWITWSAFGTGTVDNSTAGVVHVSISSGGPSTGDRILLFTLTFKVAFDDRETHIWRNTSPHALPATISLDTTYGDLSFVEGILYVDGHGPTPITPPATIDLTINLIQGDVAVDGQVDVYDLRTIASQYDKTVPPALAKYDVKTDGTIDIFDLVVVATNFNYYVPDSP